MTDLSKNPPAFEKKLRVKPQIFPYSLEIDPDFTAPGT